MNKTLLASLVALLVFCTGTARAAPPATFSYSGFLSDSAGNPVASATTLTFRLYTAVTGGSPVFQEAISVVPGNDGYFSAVIGAAGTPLGVGEFQDARFMSVQYAAEAEMAPRIALTSVPSAFSALVVDWNGIGNRPDLNCGGATPFVTGVGQDGQLKCAATPSGSALACGNGEVLKWNGSAWTCSSTSAGTVTSLSAGAGLTGGTITASGTIAVDATAVQTRIGGTCGVGSSIRVINQDGTVSCQAAGAGMVTSVSPAFGGGVAVGGTATAPTVGLQTCGGDGQVLRWNAAFSSWTCASAYSVSATSPLGGSSTATSATISIAKATTTSDGYLAATDFAAFAGKQAAITTGCPAGNAIRVVDPSTGAPTCQAVGSGSVTSVAAGTGLAGGTITTTGTLSVNFAGTGSAASAARSDHSHPVYIHVPMGDFRMANGAPVLTNVTMGPASIPAWQVSGVQEIGAAVVVPVLNANPTVRLTFYNAGATALTIPGTLTSTGIAAGQATPICQWGGPGLGTVIPAGQTVIISASLSSSVCNSGQGIGVGDLFWFGINLSSAPTFHVIGAEVVF